MSFWNGLIFRGDITADDVLGTMGNDTILTIGGDDTIDGGAGDDSIGGGHGDDLFRVHVGQGHDIIRAGWDWDRLQVFSDGVSRMRVEKVGPGIVDVSLNGVNYLHSFGLEFIDVFGGPQADYIEGLADDPTTPSRGGDTLNGGGGNDTIFGLFGNDLVQGQDGRDLLDGDMGDDTVSGGEDNDTADGGGGDDVVTGEGGDDELNGGDGNDNIDGGAGDDDVNGQKGDDLVQGGAGNDRVEGGTEGNDTLKGGAGDDTGIGGIGNDRLEMGIGNDILDGGLGVDTLIGGDGNDTLIGGANDGVLRNQPRDQLQGGAGTDHFVFARYAGLGVDEITDFTAQDEIDLRNVGFLGRPAEGNIDLRQGIDPEAPSATKRGWLLFDVKSGELAWDRDGALTGYAPVTFAILTNGGRAAHLDAGQLHMIDS